MKEVERISYSVPEVAAAVGVSSRTLWDFIKRGELAVCRLGTRVLIPAAELQRFIQERTQVAGQDTPVIGSPEGVSR